MARITALLVVALAVAAFGEPLRRRRSTNTIAAAGDAEAVAAGAASSNHGEAILAVGGPGWVAPAPSSGWGPGWVAEPAPAPIPAVIAVSSGGDAVVGQQAVITEITENQQNQVLTGIQIIDVNQVAEGDTGLLVAASGLDAALASNAASSADGIAASSAAGDLSISSTP